MTSKISGRISLTPAQAVGRISLAPAQAVGHITRPEVEVLPAYDGAYSISPSTEQQVLHTAGKKMASDVVVGPIPNNYGLITWDGTVITVS